MNHSFLSSCTSGGCGAKIGPGELSEILSMLPSFHNPNLLIGYDSSDDAAVYQLTDELSLITTLDFFSPMVDDPYLFGKIAAANALSDVYAMGGKPFLALNIVCFPETMDLKILQDILTGGAEKAAEAETVIAGGHSIYDSEPKYGLSVIGKINPDHIVKNNTPKVGHQLILTKPLGTGIVMAAHRVNLASDQAVATATNAMAQLNRYAAEKMLTYDISACTDITGFGLLSHGLEMSGDTVSLKLYPKKLPHIPEAYDYAADYLLTAAGQRNRNFVGERADVSGVDFPLQELLFDPQTSGGLLIAVSPNESEDLLKEIKKDYPFAEIIGEVLPKQNQTILFEEA